MVRKIGFLGLDAAGKTSFLSVLGKTYSSMIDPKPTKGIERSTSDVIGQTIDLWDFGGQEQYRDRYLRSEKDLKGFDLVFYLVDIQDKNRFNESGEYLTNLLEKMDDFDQNNLVVCFHKNDPDLKRKLEPQLKTAWEKMEDIAIDAYAFLPTSIFDEQSITRAFSMGLRKIATKKEIIEQELLNLCREIETKGVVVLNSNGLVMGSYVFNEDLTGKIENLGISLSNLWEVNEIKFEEIVGKADFGDFRFDKAPTEVRDYFVLTMGTTEQYDLKKLKQVLESLG
ncbi:MAG: ADP-ribosylation factor-like protein [Candidatus Hodarchaeota archaeon]